MPSALALDRKSTRLNSSHTEIYTLSLHDALPICLDAADLAIVEGQVEYARAFDQPVIAHDRNALGLGLRSEEHTSELQSHRDLHSFPTRRSSDLPGCGRPRDCRRSGRIRPGFRSAGHSPRSECPRPWP